LSIGTSFDILVGFGRPSLLYQRRTNIAS